MGKSSPLTVLAERVDSRLASLPHCKEGVDCSHRKVGCHQEAAGGVRIRPLVVCCNLSRPAMRNTANIPKDHWGHQHDCQGVHGGLLEEAHHGIDHHRNERGAAEKTKKGAACSMQRQAVMLPRLLLHSTPAGMGGWLAPDHAMVAVGRPEDG
jgi:hypothetical protein